MTTATVSIETITPDIAREMLHHNLKNRKVRPGRVDLYADAMRSGFWTLTGESVVFDQEGVVVNGQHRLLACIAAGAPFQTVVVRGVDASAYDHTDIGMARQVADTLKARGVHVYTTIAAAARLVLAYEAGAMRDNAAIGIAASRDRIIAEVESNLSAYETAASRATGMRSIGMNSSAGVAFMVLAGRRADPNVIGSWVDQLIDGSDMTVGDPRLALRSWFVNARRLQAPFYLASLIHAFNSSVKGEGRKTIKTWVRGAPFPRIDDGLPAS